MEMSNFNSPQPGVGYAGAPPSIVASQARMVSLGFPSEWAEMSLHRCMGDFERAILFCYENGAQMDGFVAEEKERRYRLSVGMPPPPPPPSGGGGRSVEAKKPEINHKASAPPAPSSSSNSKKKEEEVEAPKDMLTTVTDCMQSTSFILTAMWMGWLLMGTIFYASNNGYKVGQAFYMAVNVGYSIGWGYPADPSNSSKIFSIFYVLMGSSAISAALGMFAAKMVADNDSWYEDAIQLAEFNHKLATATTSQKIYAWCEYNIDLLKPIALWFLWVVFAVTWSMVHVKWSFVDALYFAITSMSTGGLWAIPPGSSDGMYGIVGVFAATGCPLMALAMATVASFFIGGEDPEETTRKILQPVTMEEINMMGDFGLENGDGEVDMGEYIILCMVRIGAVTPTLVDEIITRFKALDHSGDGSLSYAELMQEHDPDGNVISHDGETKEV